MKCWKARETQAILKYVENLSGTGTAASFLYLTRTRKTGCWLTCHYAAVCPQPLTQAHKFFFFFIFFYCSYSQRFGQSESRGGILRADTHRSPLGDDTAHRAATIRPPGFPFSLDSIIQTGQIWTPLRFGRSFCTVIIIVIIYFWRRRRRRGGQTRREAAQWIRWFHFLRFDFVCCSRLVEVSQLLRF